MLGKKKSYIGTILRNQYSQWLASINFCLLIGKIASSSNLNILRTLQTERASKISGISFEQDTDPSKFMTLGTHISLDQLKSMYKFKGP